MLFFLNPDQIVAIYTRNLDFFSKSVYSCIWDEIKQNWRNER